MRNKGEAHVTCVWTVSLQLLHLKQPIFNSVLSQFKLCHKQTNWQPHPVCEQQTDGSYIKQCYSHTWTLVINICAPGWWSTGTRRELRAVQLVHSCPSHPPTLWLTHPLSSSFVNFFSPPVHVCCPCFLLTFTLNQWVYRLNLSNQQTDAKGTRRNEWIYCTSSSPFMWFEMHCVVHLNPTASGHHAARDSFGPREEEEWKTRWKEMLCTLHSNVPGEDWELSVSVPRSFTRCCAIIGHKCSMYLSLSPADNYSQEVTASSAPCVTRNIMGEAFIKKQEQKGRIGGICCTDDEWCLKGLSVYVCMCVSYINEVNN